MYILSSERVPAKTSPCEPSLDGEVQNGCSDYIWILIVHSLECSSNRKKETTRITFMMNVIRAVMQRDTFAIHIRYRS
jgi:hypothetical protein